MRMRGGLFTGSLRQPCMLPPIAHTLKNTGVSRFETDFGTMPNPSLQPNTSFSFVFRSALTREVPP